MKQNLNEFLASVNAQAYKPTQNATGCMILINVPTSKRIRFSKAFMRDLGEPAAIKLYFTEESIIVVPSAAGTQNAISFSSGGMIYNSPLAEKIMEMSKDEFPSGKSVRVGSYTMTALDDGTSYAEVKFN